MSSEQIVEMIYKIRRESVKNEFDYVRPDIPPSKVVIDNKKSKRK